MDAEKALSSMGNPWTCRWTVLCFIVICMVRNLTVSWNLTAIVFLGAVPEHRCRVPQEGASLPQGHNPTQIPDSRPVVAGSCHVHHNATGGNTSTYCPDGWEYGGETYSMVNQWDLVCDQDYMADLSQVVFIIGTMLGGLCMGHFTDKFGRKRVLLSCIGAVGVLTLCCAWVPDFYVLMVLRFLTGLVVQGVVLSGLVSLMEMFPSQHRSAAGCLLMASWGVCMVFLAAIAYFVRDWRYLMTIMAMPCLLAIPGIWLFQDTIPWLMAQNKLKEANEVLQRMAKWNGRKIDVSAFGDPSNGLLRDEIVTEVVVKETKSGPPPPEALHKPCMPSPSILKKPTSMFSVNIKQVFSQSKQDLQGSQLLKFKEESSETSSVNSSSTQGDDDDGSPILLMCTNPMMRRNVIILCYAFICISLSFFGLSLNTGNLAGNVYMNFSLSGLMEIPACGLAGLASRCLGRKRVLSASYVVGGLLLWLTVIVPAVTDGQSGEVATICFSMMGKFCCAIGYCLLPIYCVELFPTTIRSFCLGTVYFIGRIGTILAPMSVYATRHVWWFAGASFGTAIITAGLLILLLPETKGNDLVQNVRGMEETYGKRRTKKSVDL